MLETFNDYLSKLKELIQCNTVAGVESFNEKNARQFQDLLKKQFPSVFYKCRIKEIDKSLIIELIGKRSTAPALFLCHYDTAEIKGDWYHDPLRGYIEDGKMFGRGVLDAKGNLFCLFEALDQLIKEGYTPSQDIYVALLSDREGANKSIEDVYLYFKNNNIYFSYIMDEGGFVVNSPLDGLSNDYAMVGVGEQASAILKISSLINGSHASISKKEYALMNLAFFIEEFSDNDVFKKSIHKSVHDTFHQLAQEMKGFRKFVFSNSKIMNPFVKMYLRNEPLALSAVQSSLSFITIHGSDYENTITSEAYAICNLRIGLNDTLDKCLKKINKIANYYHLKVEVIKEYSTSRVTSIDSYQYSEIEDAIKDVYNVSTIPYITSFTTNTRIMERLTGNCFRFVPFRVTRDQVLSIHGLDENIDVDCIDKAVDFYKKLIKN